MEATHPETTPPTSITTTTIRGDDKDVSNNSESSGDDHGSHAHSDDGCGSRDGGATVSSQEPEVAPESKRRESIRARLREREERLSRLVRSASGEGTTSFVAQMASIQETLKQVEAEKSELETELDRLKHATDDDEFLKEKMNGIQEGFMKQVQTIQTLEDEVLAKKSEIDQLKDQLVSKLHRIVELEFDLETHDVHYTEYAAEQFKLGEEALAEIKSKEKELAQHGNESLASLGSEHSAGGTRHKLAPKRAQKLISKLLGDLDNLEARYKEEKLGAASKMEELRLANAELKTKLRMMEQNAQANKGSVATVTPEKVAMEPKTKESEDVVFLRKRVEQLEARRSLVMDEKERVEAELLKTKKEASSDLKKAGMEIERLRLENDAMKARIDVLQTEIMEEDPSRTQFALVDKRIRESYDRIARLEAALEIKDRQLGTARKEVSRLRAKEIAHSGVAGGMQFSDKDVALLRSFNAHKADNQRGGVGGSESAEASAYVADLHKQLQHAQQLLVKKDQELVIERAKSASTAAGLLARITELSGSKPSKRRSGLRRYL